MSDPDEPDTTTTDPVSTPSPTTRQSGWTCSLPREILSVILELLVDNKAARTLANVQSTSSAMYSLATPYLYREINLTLRSAACLFGQFADISRVDNRLFRDIVPADTHLLDLHVCHRLRAFFSHTQTILFQSRDDSRLSDEGSADIGRYKELVTGLAAFGHPGLWPNVEVLQIEMKAGTPYDGTPYELFGSDVEAICMHIQPNTMFLTLPGVASESDLYSEEADALSAWGPWTRTLCADHVTLANFPLSFPHRLSIARKTLTVEWYHGDPVQFAQLENLLAYGRLLQPNRLVIKGSFCDSLENEMTHEEVYEGLERYIMGARAECGHKDDLEIEIISPHYYHGDVCWGERSFFRASSRFTGEL